MHQKTELGGFLDEGKDCKTYDYLTNKNSLKNSLDSCFHAMIIGLYKCKEQLF